MILKPFTVTSQGTQYRFVERSALDSEALKAQVTQMVQDNHAFSQFEAMCAQLGLSEFGAIPSMRFAVFDGSTLVGIWGLAKLNYISGPWADTINWVVTDPQAPAIWSARPMPGFLGLDPAVETQLAVDTAVVLLGQNAPFRSTEDTHVGFTSLHWAVLLTHTDPISVRAQGLHAAAKADGRLSVTETVDPENALRTLVQLELS
jgi:hypothetical protein